MGVMDIKRWTGYSPNNDLHVDTAPVCVECIQIWGCLEVHGTMHYTVLLCSRQFITRVMGNPKSTGRYLEVDQYSSPSSCALGHMTSSIFFSPWARVRVSS